MDTTDKPSTTSSSGGWVSVSANEGRIWPDCHSHASAATSDPSSTTTTGGANSGASSRAMCCTPAAGISVRRSLSVRIIGSRRSAAASLATSPSGVSLFASRYSTFFALTVRPNAALTRPAISPTVRWPSISLSTRYSRRDRCTT